MDVVKKTKVKKAVNMRALPIFYIADDENMAKCETENAQDQTEAKVKETVEAFDKVAKRYIEILHESGYPTRCCGKRTNCCGNTMNSLFHECKQMGIVLRKSFKGSHIWIPPIHKQIKDEVAALNLKSDLECVKNCVSYDPKMHKPSDMVKIDAMFFTASEEPLVFDASKLDKNNQEAKYLDYDTIILCNPNAMSYQHMINYPHAYYLKWFLNKQINCLVWNYRGYGRTRGDPKPQQFE